MFDRGDLLLVPFPFSDLSTAKRRPVVAVTGADAYGDFLALAVTSRPQASHGLPIGADSLVAGTLPLASWVRTDRIVTLNASLVIKAVGRISEAFLTLALERVCAFIEDGMPLPPASPPGQ